jgi:hypothetical protein
VEVGVGFLAGLQEPALGGGEAEGEEFADAESEAAFELELLRNVADAAEGFGGNGLAEEADVAGMEALQAEQAAEERGFAGAVRADERDDFAFGNAEVDAVENGDAVESDTAVADFSDDVAAVRGGGLALGTVVGHLFP